MEFAGKRIGITICEDIWTHAMISTRRLYNGVDPVAQLAGRCDVMVNLSASPWNHVEVVGHLFDGSRDLRGSAAAAATLPTFTSLPRRRRSTGRSLLSGYGRRGCHQRTG